MTHDLTERCFRALIDTGDDVFVLADEHATVLYVSASVERVLGYTPDDLLGEIALDFAHPADTAHDLGTLEQILASPDETIESRHRTRHRDGHYLEMEVRARNLLRDPEVHAIALSARDVTARNVALRRAAEQETQLRHLADNARDIIAIYRFLPTPRLEYISPSVERILGYPRQLYYDDPTAYEKLIHPDDAARQDELVQNLPDRLDEPWVFRWIREDGGVVWVEQNMVPILDDQGRHVATHTVSRDVTDKVALENELRRAQKMEALGRMAGGVAHDFNNLLGVVRLATGSMARRFRERPPEELDQIEAAVIRGARLVEALVAFSRRDENDVATVNLNEVMVELEEMLRRLLPDSVSVTCAPDASRPWIPASTAALEQIMLNLAINAGDAMPDGGELSIATSDDGDRVALTVRDTGVGMDEDQLDRAFDPFYTTKAPGRRTGLGLSVVYGVVEKSGGRISIDSSPGQGSEIRIEWPRAAEPPSTAEHTTPDAEPGNHEVILMVEDEAPLRDLIATSLRQDGYRVHVAENADQALTIFRAHAGAIDLVLTDVVMPGKSGVELAEQIRGERDDVPVVFMSGHAGKALADHGVTEAVLRKPFTIDDLAAIVRSALDGD